MATALQPQLKKSAVALDAAITANTPRPAAPRTQKARSVFALSKWGFNVPLCALVQSAEQIPEAETIYPRFARPCPVTPRHGFVDSRIVNSSNEARQVFAEAVAADPQAEMLLMEPINAKCSAVLTPGSVTLGPGHDGATQGKECATFALSGCNIEGSGAAIAAGITEWPFVEAVFKESGNCYLTQLRNGPRVNGCGADRIPSDIIVSDVVTLHPAALPDALEWESRCKALPLTTAIYHPKGSQTSHYAAHAALRGLPVFTTRKPYVGESLKANVGALLPYDMPAFRRGVTQGFQVDCNTWIDNGWNDRGVRIGLLAVHHAMALREGAGAWLLGYGIALLVRYGITASCGEARYARNRSRLTRSDIYHAMLSDPITALKRGTKLFRLFVEHAWGGGSVGGPAWARCTKATLDLDYALRRAYHEGSEERFKDLIAAAHVMVNCAHNGGWYLNKFCTRKAFDRHAAADMMAILTTAHQAYLDYVTPPQSGDATARKWSEKRKARLLREGKRALVIVVRMDGNDLHFQIRRGERADVRFPIPLTDARYYRDWYEKCVPARAIDGTPGDWRLVGKGDLPYAVNKEFKAKGVIL